MACRGAFDIVQPDVTKVGGISEQRRIAWMADDFGIKYVGHGWNTALGVAADLQLAAAFPAADLVEYIGGSPYVDGILADPFELDADGFLADPRTVPGSASISTGRNSRATRPLPPPCSASAVIPGAAKRSPEPMNTKVRAPPASSRSWIPGSASQPGDDRAGMGHLERILLQCMISN